MGGAINLAKIQILSLGPSTVLIGGAIIAAIGYGGYKAYKYYRYGNNQVLQSVIIRQSNIQDEFIPFPQMAEWKIVKLPQQDLEYIKNLTNKMFQERIQLYSCPISHLIMRQPVIVPCCKNIFERNMIQYEIKTKTICPLCRKSILISELKSDIKTEDAINYFRLQIRKLYRSFSQQQQKKQKERIELSFGEGYIENNL